jgi:polar amino acid transport system substrate-binding protein
MRPVSAELRKEFAPEGVLRAGINLGNPVIAQPGADGGEPRGVAAALARELARRLGVAAKFVTFPTAGEMADAVTRGAWDLAFLAIDPARAAAIEFSPAYVHIEGTYMVRENSSFRNVGAVDRPGVRIAVGLKTAYDLYLTRHIRNAELVRAPSSAAAIRQFLDEKLDVVAGVRQPLVAACASNKALRVMADSFMVIKQAAGVPNARREAARYLSAFIEEVKASGFVARALGESGVHDVSVAPPVGA